MLTNKLILSLTPTARIIKKADGGGLYLCLRPSGASRWYLAYRYEGKQRTLKGGTYPETSIDRARVWREEMRAKIKGGQDPAEIHQQICQQSEYEQLTFEELANEWLSRKRHGWTARYALITERRLKADIYPYLGHLSVRKITPSMILEALRGIEERGAIVTTHRLRSYCSQIFRSGIPDGRVLINPCTDVDTALCPAPKVKHYAKVPVAQLPDFFSALNADKGSRIVHLALRWTILTMVRTKETRFAQWNEFEGLDSAEPIWRIPAQRMKKRIEHVVPLPPQALQLLREIKSLNHFGKIGDERFGKYLFPASGNIGDTIGQSAMYVLVSRLNMGDVTVHGFRRLASTVLNESGLFSPDWIEMLLAHTPVGVRSVYNAARYLSQRRKMISWWADFLEKSERAAFDFDVGIEKPAVKRVGPLDWFQRSW